MSMKKVLLNAKFFTFSFLKCLSQKRKKHVQVLGIISKYYYHLIIYN